MSCQGISGGGALRRCSAARCVFAPVCIGSYQRRCAYRRCARNAMVDTGLVTMKPHIRTLQCHTVAARTTKQLCFAKWGHLGQENRIGTYARHGPIHRLKTFVHCDWFDHPPQHMPPRKQGAAGGAATKSKDQNGGASTNESTLGRLVYRLYLFVLVKIWHAELCKITWHHIKSSKLIHTHIENHTSLMRKHRK